MIELTRVENWHTKLTAFINERRDEPFVWGTHDCSLWSADCVKITTGVDFAEKARGKYKDVLGAYKILKKVYKVDNIKEVYSSRFEETHIVYARPGDVVYQNSNYEGFNCAIGICNGSQSFFIHDPEDAEQGLFMLPTLDCDGAFRIG